MESPNTVQALAEAWRVLFPNHHLEPARRDELARRVADCLAYLAGELTQRDPTVTDLAVAREIRLCERLARAIQSGQPLTHAPYSGDPRRPSARPSTEVAVRVESRVGVGAVVEIRGYVGAADLALGLATLGRALVLAEGALLVDARGNAGHSPDCGAVLADWVSARRGFSLRRVAVVVTGLTQFVRASRALAVATGIDWLITHDRSDAERWLHARATN